jgi:hypothetical protein
MHGEVKRRLQVVRMHPDECVEMPEGATVVNSWVESGPAQHAGDGAVLVLVDVRVTEAEAEAAWAKRWTVRTPRVTGGSSMGGAEPAGAEPAGAEQ